MNDVEINLGKIFKILEKAIDFFLGGEYYYQEANKSFLKEVIFMEVWREMVDS